jgi:hypothetical protein
LIEATFAPSDMGPPQQSLVLKHIETWKRCVARGYRLSAFAWFLFSAPRQQVRGSFGVIGIALLLAWSLTSLFSSHFHTFNEGHLIAILLGVCLAREVGTQSHALSAA